MVIVLLAKKLYLHFEENKVESMFPTYRTIGLFRNSKDAIECLELHNLEIENSLNNELIKSFYKENAEKCDNYHFDYYYFIIELSKDDVLHIIKYFKNREKKYGYSYKTKFIF